MVVGLKNKKNKTVCHRQLKSDGNALHKQTDYKSIKFNST